jgi:hypothetical protein
MVALLGVLADAIGANTGNIAGSDGRRRILAR